MWSELENTAILIFVYLIILFSLLSTNSPENEQSRRDNTVKFQWERALPSLGWKTFGWSSEKLPLNSDQ